MSKTCPCCGASISPEQWDALPLLGTQQAGEENGYRYWLELRDCACESTLAIEFKEALS